MVQACHHHPVPETAVLAELVRSGFVEGQHLGHAVIVDPTGAIAASWGDPQAVIFPRSANKPAQASAMVQSGLRLEPALLALAASSHSGEAPHLAGVRRILAGVGLTEDALRTPADYPLDPVERDDWVRADRGPVSVAMNCSGKHAGMLATCVVRNWPLADYRSPDHPLQRAIAAQVSTLAGEPIRAVGVDGCGAPVLGLTMAGLARSLSAVVQAPHGSSSHQVAAAMRAHPQMVGGRQREVSALMDAVPGLLVKDGAEGVFVAALPDGHAVAVKALDGADRARLVVLADLLGRLGVAAQALEPYRSLPIHGGGAVVGEVRSALPPSHTAVSR
jgi:L-asparaginase II